MSKGQNLQLWLELQWFELQLQQRATRKKHIHTVTTRNTLQCSSCSNFLSERKREIWPALNNSSLAVAGILCRSANSTLWVGWAHFNWTNLISLTKRPQLTGNTIKEEILLFCLNYCSETDLMNVERGVALSHRAHGSGCRGYVRHPLRQNHSQP